MTAIYRRRPAGLLVVLLALVIGACNLNNIKINDPSPLPTPSPTATPAASPTPTPSSGSSDVASMVIFVYGYSCAPGITAPENSSFRLPMGCRASATATPKRADGTDATNHGNQISWAPGTAVADVEPHELNPLFNRVITPRALGQITLFAVLVDPAGRRHEAARTITVVP
jgi:hypothetical protein